MDIYGIYHASFQRDLKAEEAAFLDNVLEKHPYFSLAHYLKAKYLQSDENIFFASAYSVNRTQLRQYLKGNCLLFAPDVQPDEEGGSDKLLSPEKMPDPPEVSPAHDSDPGSYDLFSVLEFSQESYVPPSTKEPFGQLVIDPLLEKFALLQTQIQLQVAKHKKLIALIQAELLEQAAQAAQINASSRQNLRKHSANLIDRFLSMEPKKRSRAKPVSPKQKEVPQAKTSIEQDDELVTETLAKLHLKQNNREEALRMYRKLRLRFPEKSAYFDAQIEKITHS